MYPNQKGVCNAYRVSGVAPDELQTCQNLRVILGHPSGFPSGGVVCATSEAIANIDDTEIRHGNDLSLPK